MHTSFQEKKRKRGKKIQESIACDCWFQIGSKWSLSKLCCALPVCFFPAIHSPGTDCFMRAKYNLVNILLWRTSTGPERKQKLKQHWQFYHYPSHSGPSSPPGVHLAALWVLPTRGASDHLKAYHQLWHHKAIKDIQSVRPANQYSNCPWHSEKECGCPQNMSLQTERKADFTAFGSATSFLLTLIKREVVWRDC